LDADRLKTKSSVARQSVAIRLGSHFFQIVEILYPLPKIIALATAAASCPAGTVQRSPLSLSPPSVRNGNKIPLRLNFCSLRRTDF
jgi:hypothetical protein